MECRGLLTTVVEADTNVPVLLRDRHWFQLCRAGPRRCEQLTNSRVTAVQRRHSTYDFSRTIITQSWLVLQTSYKCASSPVSSPVCSYKNYEHYVTDFCKIQSFVTSSRQYYQHGGR